jgi:hypothetical protein
MKVPIQFDDFDPQDPDIEFRKNRWNYWNVLKDVHAEYLADVDALQGQFDADDFGTYVERNYGLKMHIVDGKITDKFDIVDEKLYTFFILKWK